MSDLSKDYTENEWDMLPIAERLRLCASGEYEIYPSDMKTAAECISFLEVAFFDIQRDAKILKIESEYRIAELEAALEQIMLQETPYSSATVRRMSGMARKALGREKNDV